MTASLMYLTGEELRKLFHGGKLKALLAISFLAGLLFVLFAGYAGLEKDVPRNALELLLPVLLPLLMAALGSELMAGEFKDGTIKNALKLPVSRENLFMGKMFAGWIAGALIVMGLFVPAFLGGLWLDGMPGLSELGIIAGEAAGAIVFCGLLVVLSNAVALWTGGGGASLVLCVAFWMAMNVIGLLEPELGRWFVTGYADWAQPLLRGSNPGTTISMLLIIAAYYIMGTIFGLWAFLRKEA